ncbi:hypothetical protein [Actinokineospora cianjurensis]|uniref:Uncharacterized protein n=1 Tax=Actinokineospora cianjurensis TaxID=585224 RepID=A0A421BD97_9PSEU|nr:hypothetical protein [Actinokineospora cianjurensis]RLK62280.1 hypothetical protein CLV68_2837 [Actinokineospora cianjurensis]
MSGSIFGHMAASLRDYLEELSDHARTGSDLDAARLARTELPRVVAALRAVLDEHRPGRDGRCPTCRTRLFTRAPSPCRAYLTAHLSVLVTEDCAPEDTAEGHRVVDRRRVSGRLVDRHRARLAG